MAEDDCDAELRLGIGTHCPSKLSDDTTGSCRVEGGSPSKQITMFYNGRICVCDVTETQAREIIAMAKRAMEEDKKHHLYLQNGKESAPTPRLSPLQLLNPGLPMKRSLQLFLEKRRTRINAFGPYNHKHQLSSSPTL